MAKYIAMIFIGYGSLSNRLKCLWFRTHGYLNTIFSKLGILKWFTIIKEHSFELNLCVINFERTLES